MLHDDFSTQRQANARRETHSSQAEKVGRSALARLIPPPPIPYPHQWIPNQLFLEEEIPQDVRTNLSSRGHLLTETGSIGAAQAVVIDGQWLYGASDPRKGSYPAGY